MVLSSSIPTTYRAAATNSDIRAPYRSPTHPDTGDNTALATLRKTWASTMIVTPHAKSVWSTTRITAKAWLTKLAVTRSMVPIATTSQA